MLNVLVSPDVSKTARIAKTVLVEVDLIANSCAKKQWWKVAPESHTSEVDKVVEDEQVCRRSCLRLKNAKCLR